MNKASSTRNQPLIGYQTRKPAILRLLNKSQGALIGIMLVSLWLGLALFGPWVLNADPNRQDLSSTLLPPAWDPDGNGTHPLGTDHLGRDMLTRIVYGARTSLVTSVAAVMLGGLIGTLSGLIAAEWGGWVDEVIMRIVDIQLAIPFILLGITVMAMLGASIPNLVLVLVLFSWVIYARVVRSEVLNLREREFVLSAYCLGVPRWQIVLRHLLPNVMGLILAVGTLELANVIILESALSFLGVGVRPPQVSWGAMLADGRNYLTVAWWLTTLPGLTITITILGVNLVGDWVTEVLDPRRRWKSIR